MRFMLLIFFLIPVLVFGQYITPNTGVVWNMDSLTVYSGGVVSGVFPNYEVTNKITVSANDKVVILPGTTVNFITSVSGIDVNGRFSAVGTISDSIRFTSPVADSTGFYTGFLFNASSVDSECVISYASIKYADYGLRCIDASPTLQNSYLYKCGRGAQLSTSNAKILNNTIERSYEYGILVNLNSNPLIEGNTIKFNNTQGTSAKNQISIGLQGNNSPVIRNNIVRGGNSTPTGGISLWVSGSSSDMLAEGNEIFNNSFGMTIYVTSGTCTARIRNNKIYNNNINPNRLTSGSGINVNGVPGNTPVISGNEIFGNWWGITIQNGTSVQAGPQPNLGNLENADTTDDGRNIIYNNIQDTTHFDLYNNCTNDIFAQNNDWRVYDSTSIENHIFHKVDNSLHGLVKFMPFSLYIPVELVSFAASVEGNNVTLSWITATEQNNKGFEIEILEESKSSWEYLGFIIGNGTTTSNSTYSFNHFNSGSGKFFYRIKQIDFNGSFKIYDAVEVVIAAVMSYALHQNYPNPFNPSTVIEYRIPENSAAGNTTLKIFDIIGNETAVLVNEFQSPGNYKVEFDAEGFANGVYFYELRAGDFVSVKKMILIK